MNIKIAIIGAGSFGTALAKLFSIYDNIKIILWSALIEEIEEIKKNQENKKKLPGIKLDLSKITITSDIKSLNDVDLVIFAVASKYTRQVARKVCLEIDKKAIIISASKGMEEESFKRLSTVIFEETKSKQIAVLSGPSHAEEIAKHIPTAVVVSSSNFEISQKVQKILNSSIFRVYVNNDVIGVEIAATVKNIIAIAAGLCDGLNLGDNAKAVIITRGLVEMKRLGIFLGAKPTTFSGLAGMGDLIATCTSLHSRNKMAGFLIAKGTKPTDALKKINMIVEGYYATKIIYNIAKKENISMPITEQLYKILYEGQEIKKSIDNLMSRSTKNEY